jgi:hypothetical protein
MNTINEIVNEIDRRVQSAEVGDMEELGYFVRENWAALRPVVDSAWQCKARAGAFDPPVDCDWPTCGCDPLAQKVIDALEEAGWKSPHADDFKNCEACGALTDFNLMRMGCEGDWFCPHCFDVMHAERTPDETAPHEFAPIRFWDRWHDNGRCRACFYPRWVHPTNFWNEARPMMDFSKARLPGSEDVVR